MKNNMDENKKNKIKDTRAKIWFVLNMICSISYLLWRIFFTIPFEYGLISIIAGIALLVVEALGLVEALVHYVNMYNTRDYKKPEIEPEMFPDVDIFVATYNEPVEILEKTLRACKRMDYPNKNKVHIYLCDDGRRSEMKLLAESLKINYLDRKDNSGHKAGNLNNALAHSSSPYIVTFDSDMLPQSCFLMETIPYFVDAEIRNKGRKPEEQIRLGYLQTPQSFYDMDLFQFNLHSENKIPNEQDYFYRDIEVARTRTNSCIYGGSNTVLSRKALEDIGGFYTGAITEDFATGILIQKKGYVTLAIGKKLASGVSAKTLQDLIQQRVRWARGVISTGRKMHIYTSKDLSFGQKINYWASIWYWFAPVKRFIYIMSPILYATFGFMVFRCTLWQVLLFWLPMYVTSNISLKSLSNNVRNTKWTSIYEYALFPYMIIPVILESFGISLTKFKVTKKGGKDEGKNPEKLLYMAPVLILIILSIIGIIHCIMIMFDSGSLGPIVVLFWLVYNLFNMIMCMFFIDGRNVYRGAERVYVALNGVLHIGENEYPFVTKDISETGMAMYLDKPILIEEREGQDIYCEITDRKWKCCLRPQVKYSQEEPKREDNKWLYTFIFEGFCGADDYDQLLAILYDRVPTNPSEIKKNNGLYDDLSTNLEKRFSENKYMKRHYPRIRLGCAIPAIADGKEVEIFAEDFNYQYFSTRQGKAGDEVYIILGDIKMPVVYEQANEKIGLYKIKDFEKVYPDQKTSDEIMEKLLSMCKPEENGKENQQPAEKNQDKKQFNEMDIF